MPAAALLLLLALSATSAQAQLTLFSENFEGLTLGPNQEEALAGTNVWTKTAPTNWIPNDTGMPGGVTDPATNGVTEWAGWSFASKDWWAATAGDQGRSQFVRGSGTVMIADPDEWDDGPQVHPEFGPGPTYSTAACTDVNPCLYDTFITTPTFIIPPNIPAGEIRIAFDSSWNPEGQDEPDAPAFAPNNQRATINVTYYNNNVPAPKKVLQFDSAPNTLPDYHAQAYSEAVERDLQYDGTSTSMSLTFGLDLAVNDWWWAVDNIRVIVPADPSKLRIDTATGHVSIVGGDTISTPINSFDIASTLGVLNGAGLSGLSTTKPDSVDGAGDPDSIVGNSSGEFWQNLSATNNHIAEAFLFGSSSYNTSRTDFLGTIFNTATPVGSRDVSFTYTTIFGDTVNGIVEYCTGCSPAGVSGDYNNNGTVDAADYVLWRNGGPLLNDPTPGVQAADYSFWRSRFGPPRGAAAAQVWRPCPSRARLRSLAWHLLRSPWSWFAAVAADSSRRYESCSLCQSALGLRCCCASLPA